MKATTIASTVSRWPSLGCCCASWAADLREAGVGADFTVEAVRPIVGSSPVPSGRPGGRPVLPSRFLGHDGPARKSGGSPYPAGYVPDLMNVPDSARIGNPINRPAEELQGHDLPGKVHQERLAQEHRPRNHRTSRPEPRVVGDRAVVAQHEKLVGTKLVWFVHSMRTP